MKRFFYFLLMVATATLVGCSKDETTTTSNSNSSSSSSSSSGSSSSGSSSSSSSSAGFSDSGLASSSSSATNTDDDSDFLNAVPDTIDYTNDYISENFTASATTTITFSSSGASYDNLQSGDAITITEGTNYVVVTLANSGTVLKLTGDASSGGAIKITSDKKFELNLSNVSITNPNGSAINIQDGHCFVVVDGDNTLSDASSSGYSDSYSSKSVFHSEDKLRFSGSGSLTITAKNAEGKHALTSDDWIFVNGPTITATAGSSAGQCIKVNDGFHMVSGAVTATAKADGKKAIKSGAFVYVEAGTLTATASGSYTYDDDDAEYKAAAGINADGYVMISGGTVDASCSGAGGKGITSDYIIHIKDGTVYSKSTGSTTSSTVDKSPKGMKADGGIVIEDGYVEVSSKKHEGIESKGVIRISGGYVYSESSDDAINSSYETTITGGYVMANSSGNDGIDSNKNMYIKGGNVFAIASTQPEVGLDANTEGGYQVYISGGNLVAIGGFESGASISNGTAMQASYSKGTTYALYNNSDVAFAYKVPSNNSMGSSMAVYTTGSPSVYSGVTGNGTNFWNGYGYTSATGGSSVTLSSYSNSGGMGGNGGSGRGW